MSLWLQPPALIYLSRACDNAEPYLDDERINPMAQPQTAPYGTWTSPITSDLIVSATVGLSNVRIDGDAIYWLESRPTEGGRVAIVRRAPDGSVAQGTPPPFNVRTKAPGYGGR